MQPKVVVKLLWSIKLSFSNITEVKLKKNMFLLKYYHLSEFSDLFTEPTNAGVLDIARVFMRHVINQWVDFTWKVPGMILIISSIISFFNQISKTKQLYQSIYKNSLLQGCHSFFTKFFPGFPNFFQVFKSTHFWVYFQFKLSSR